MVVRSRSDPADARTLPMPMAGRAAWLVLATDGPATCVPSEVPGTAVRVVGDPSRFGAALLAERPRIVVCAEPPAAPETLALVLAERRRRVGMRAVHLAPPDAVDARLSALAAGFDDALTTATPAHELAGRLAWLEARARSGDGAAVILSIADDIELDLAARQLRRAGVPVHLRPKEFGLLAMLAAQPGRACSRRELVDRVWGLDHAGGLRTVDVHVRWLRSKIEPEPGRPVHLVTVRGLGYRLDPPKR